MSNNAQNEFNSVVREFTLRPSRSMSERGKTIFYGTLLTAGALGNYFAIKAGFWPIAIFMDMALGGAALGMKLSDRSGREYEHILVKESEVEIRHYKPGFPQERVFKLPSFMLRVETNKDNFDICTQLVLRTRGRGVEIGSFLPPEEKEQVAVELKKALKESQMPPHLRNQL